MTVKVINSTIAGPLTLNAAYAYTTIRPTGGVTIASPSGIGVDGPSVFGETWTLENAGTIAASGNDGAGVYLYNGTVINSGLITAGLYGVEIKEGGVVTNVAGGTILSRNDDGVRFKYAAGTMVNDGLVSGGQVGVFDYPGSVITNLSQGTIAGGNYGIGGYGTVINAGTIAGGSTVDNAVAFAAGTAAHLIVDPGAVFIGTVNGGNTIGSGVTSTLEFASTAGRGTLAGLGSHYVDFGQVSIDSGANWTIGGSNSIVAGQTLTNAGGLYGDGTITNSGLLDMASYGIVQSGGSIINDGSITVGGLVGVTVLSGAVITNSAGGRITGGSFDGVQVHAGATFVNAGYVSSGEFGGAYAYPGGAVTNLAGGTLKGSRWGFADSGATLVNAGTIAAPNSTGTAVIASVYLAADSRVVVDPGAVFIGTVDGGNAIGGAYVSTLEFASASSYGTFSGLGSKYVNFAEVTVDPHAYWTAAGTNTVVAGQTLTDSGFLYTTGHFTNDGVIDAVTPPVGPKSGTFTNAGTVIGAGKEAIFAPANSTSPVTIANTGFVSATSVGVVLDDVNSTLVNDGVVTGAAYGVYGGAGTNRVVNNAHGTIAGAQLGFYGYGTVTNAGTIAAGGTSGTSVDFYAGAANELIVVPGAVFIGTVNGGNTIGGAQTSTLEFASGAGHGTFAGLGSQYVNFGQVSIDVGATWTITGDNTLVAGQTLHADSAPFLQGTLSNAGSIDGVPGGTGIGIESGILTNTGGISGGNLGVHLFGGSATLVNTGYIHGLYGVYAQYGGNVTNAAGGRIIGDGTSGFAAEGFIGFGTVVNAGSIEAIGTAHDAVAFGAGATNRLVVDPGAVFVGTVDGGNTIGAADVSTLEFASASAAGTFSGLGSHYVNFAEVTVDVGAYWTAAGSNTVVAGQTLTDSGSFYTTDTFTNDGVIDAASSTPIFPASGTFMNAGTVIGSLGFAIDAPPGSLSPVTIANTGFVSAAGLGVGVFLGDRNGTLVNDGTITGGARGVYGNAGTDIVLNNADGTITGAQAGFNGYGTVTNAGTIAAGGGTSGTAVDFASGAANGLIVVPGAVFIGTVNGGNTIGGAQTSTLDFTTGAGHGSFAGLGSQYVNFGQVSIDAGANWTASGVNTIVSGQTLTDAGYFFDTGTLTNAGLITVGTHAIGQNGGVFVNDAAITTDGGNVGINAYSGAMVSNSAGATITGGGWDGVQVHSGATLVNAGLIIGAAFGGAYGYPGGVVTNLAGGTLIGGAFGFDGFGFTLVNAGSIAATYGGGDAVGVVASADARVVVDPGAVFIGTVNGGNTIGGTYVSTLEFASGSSVGSFAGLGSHYVNFAQVSIDSTAHWTVTGVNLLASGATMTEAGLFSSFGPFTNDGYINVTGTNSLNEYNGTFGNNGRITVTGGAGYALYVEGGLVTNAATASILGGVKYGVDTSGNATLVNAGLISAGPRGGAYVGAGGVVTNLASGTIAGSGYGFSGYGFTLVNAGTVAAPNASDDAIHTLPKADARVVVDPGAVFIGTVNGGNPIGSTHLSTLEFAAGSAAGGFAGLGSQYVNFAEISIDSGAAWTASGANTLASGYTLHDAGRLTLASDLAGGGEVLLAGSGVTLVAAGGATIGPSIGDLLGNTIELLGTVEHDAGFVGGALTLDGGTTLTLAGSYSAGQIVVSNDGSNTFIVACFAAGTRIEGAFGPVPVEALRTGDLVRNFAGHLMPVRWMGHRRTDLARHPRPHDVMPVRVRAGAFGEGVPARDLVLSPDHAVFVDGRLVPIRYLINGQSIVQETRRSVTYWHVELERHDVILAEGMPCETFLDTGNRGAFENAPGAVQMTPEFARAVWAAEGCAPIVTDPADASLRALHLRLLARARQAVAA